jgi:hypothetical protein
MLTPKTVPNLSKRITVRKSTTTGAKIILDRLKILGKFHLVTEHNLLYI